MKRMLILVAIALFVTGSLIADEAVLIDFSKLVADTDTNTEDDDDTPTQNGATMMDYGKVAGASYTEEQKAAMQTSLAITNWDVILASSSRTITRQSLSYTAEAPSKQWGKVMGVRIHFPVEPWNSHAFVRPPFEIPAYEPMDEQEGEKAESSEGEGKSTTKFENGFGVIKNVGTIKSIAVNVYGLNFPHRLSAVIIDSSGKEQNMNMGYLNFDGWAELRWDNPAYVQAVRNRELRLYPLYPTSTPFIKFGGFLVERDAAKEGGDFVGYFKDVKVIYDKAILDTDRDIDDEALWQIIRVREDARKTWEMSRFGQKQVLRYLESQKQATESDFTPTEKSGEEQ